MQVRASPTQHGFSNQAPPNGVHQSPVSHSSVNLNGGHIPSEDMNPYQQQQQQHYAAGYAPQQQQPPRQQQAQQYPQQQHRQYQPHPSAYLPPMQSHQAMMSIPPPSAVPSSMYMAGQHPPTMPHGPPAHVPERQPQLSFSSSDEKYEYSLSVEQQPQRARMCGFGDKDRRPITPPPCIRLIVKDRKTGKEIDFTEIDGAFFILQVDLWADDASREVNLIRASSSSPAVSISTASVTSFPPAPEHRAMMDPSQTIMYMGPDGQPVYAALQPGYQRHMLPGQYGPAGYYPQPGYATGYGMPGSSQSTSGMYTRNLIGSLTVNASRLVDPDGKTGYWFVLQDLSVRTEGFFRLKMNFIDVGSQMNGGSGINKGKAPVLAWVFSDKFQVYSAKKFPGVIESTALSKCFAGQGIKIPIRKDAKAENADDDDD